MNSHFNTIDIASNDVWKARSCKSKDLTLTELRLLKRLSNKRTRPPEIEVIVSQNFYETLCDMGIWEK